MEFTDEQQRFMRLQELESKRYRKCLKCGMRIAPNAASHRCNRQGRSGPTET